MGIFSKKSANERAEEKAKRELSKLSKRHKHVLTMVEHNTYHPDEFERDSEGNVLETDELLYVSEKAEKTVTRLAERELKRLERDSIRAEMKKTKRIIKKLKSREPILAEPILAEPIFASIDIKDINKFRR